jgi:Dullard-like phosphatase family protein
LDLDETLVHSRFVNKDDGTIRQRERRKTATVATNEFILNIGDETIRVNRRPGLNKFLAEASELFNLYVFTAAIEEYARPVIDYLDPKKTIFAGRFYRGSCFQMPNRTYAKDLFHVCDDLKRVVRAVGARISIISHMFQSRH